MRLLKLVPENTNFQFQNLRFIAAGISVLLVVASIALVGIRGLNFGVDFTGGIVVEVGFNQPPNLDQMRSRLNTLNLGDVSLQQFGGPTEVAIRLQQQPGGEAGQQTAVHTVEDALHAEYGKDKVTVRRVETVGGKVSAELVRTGALSIGLAMLAISLYIWLRFEWQFGVGALLSLIHDVAITMGFFALTQLEFNLNIVAAILTIVGYSLNETVVVFDRTRELMRRYKTIPTEELLNLSINSTMSRTVMTGTSAFLSLLALVMFGGEAINGFAVVMLAGVVICTYSAIFVSTPALIYLGLMLSGAKAQVRPTARVPQAAE